MGELEAVGLMFLIFVVGGMCSTTLFFFAWLIDKLFSA